MITEISYGTQIVGINSGASGDIGATIDAAITDTTLPISIISALKGVIKQLQGGGTGSTPIQAAGYSAVYQQNITVTVAGTPIQFSAQACHLIFVMPYMSNTDMIYVGTSAVDALSTPALGGPIEVGGCLPFPLINTNLLYVDAKISGEGCHVLAF